MYILFLLYFLFFYLIWALPEINVIVVLLLKRTKLLLYCGSFVWWGGRILMLAFIVNRP